jgi:hypothetical protein
MVGEAARLTFAVAAATLAAAIATAEPPALVVDATCRDGEPQGPYQLRGANGQQRVAGAFNSGKRTGSFIFWNEQGVRVAHIPFDEDVRSGTVAIWYDAPPGHEPPRRLESVWRRGVRDGPTRSWYADGRLRSETEYAGGRVIATTGWSDAGQRLGDGAARALAERDARIADEDYGELDALVREHLPHCD